MRPIRDGPLHGEYGHVNSSYKQVVHNLSRGPRHPRLLSLVCARDSETPGRVADSGLVVEERGSDPRDNPLVNKEFYCVEFEKDKTGVVGQSDKAERKRTPGGMGPGNGKKSAKKDDSKHALYFLNEHNQATEGVESLLQGPRERFVMRKPKRQNIYRMLAMNSRPERQEEEPMKLTKKNTAFQNVKRILSRTEDEKQELDVCIIQFEKVHTMLGELKPLLTHDLAQSANTSRIQIEEPTRARPDSGPTERDPGSGVGDLQIEESPRDVSKGAEKHAKVTQVEDLAKRAQEIYHRHFRERVERARQRREFKIEHFEDRSGRKQELLARIRQLRVLDVIYDSNKRRKRRIVELILNNLNPPIVERLRKRVAEKLAILRKLRSHLVQNTWKKNLINNYYKSLDVRSGCLQQNEKAFLSPKYFILNLIDTEKKLRRKEAWQYWPRVQRPEMSLISGVEVDAPGETQKSDAVNQSTLFGGEEGMYDSLIKISSKNQEPGEAERNWTNENDLVKSEVAVTLREMEPEPSECVTADIQIARSLFLSNSLMTLLNRPNPFQHRLVYSSRRARWVNPLKVFTMKDQAVVRDAIFFVKVASPNCSCTPCSRSRVRTASATANSQTAF